MRLPFGQIHRLGQSTLLAEPMVGLPRKFIDGTSGKKFCGHPFERAFFCNGFGSVFAKFSNRPVIFRIWPRTTWTIKSRHLIDIKKRRNRTDNPHLLDRSRQSNFHRRSSPR